MHLGEQAHSDSTLLGVLPASRDASSVEEGTLLRGQVFVKDLQVGVLPFRAIKQGFKVL